MFLRVLLQSWGSRKSDVKNHSHGYLLRSSFPRDIILWAVRWYCRYGVSYRDLEEMMTSAGRAGRSHHDLPLGPEIRP